MNCFLPMARHFVLLLLAVSVPAACPTVALADDAAAASLPALIKHASPGIVTIVAYQPERAMPSVGTGFFVAPDEVARDRQTLEVVHGERRRGIRGRETRGRLAPRATRERLTAVLEVLRHAPPP